jgi:hypothetical protein
MKQLLSVVVQLTSTANSGSFSRTLGLNDFYWGDESFSHHLVARCRFATFWNVGNE